MGTLVDFSGISGVLYARSVMLRTTMRLPDDPVLGRSFVYWLGQACKQARELGGIKQSDIPPVSQPRISRFEQGTKWPDDPDDVVQAYAQALGITDARMLWQLAMDLWLEHGKPPTPIEIRPRVPALQEGELLQRLRAALPSDTDPAQRMIRPVDPQAESG